MVRLRDLPKDITAGAEHEWADIPLRRPLPSGYGRDTNDHTIVNTNGIANDPKGLFYAFGGEINTPPTDLMGQVGCLEELRALLPEAKVNHRSNLHIHIRIPGLKEDLALLKRVQAYIHENMPKAFPVVEPISRPTEWEFPKAAEFEGAVRRWRRRCVSHHTLLTAQRLERQLEARSLREFFELEVPWDRRRRPQWQCQPRLCVNLRQLMETDTVEFRHFPGTLDSAEMGAALQWCYRFLLAAVAGDDFGPVLAWAKQQKFPRFPPYVHWREVRYRATAHDGTVPRPQLLKNIAAIEAGTFDEIGRVPLD